MKGIWDFRRENNEISAKRRSSLKLFWVKSLLESILTGHFGRSSFKMKILKPPLSPWFLGGSDQKTLRLVKIGCYLLILGIIGPTSRGLFIWIIFGVWVWALRLWFLFWPRSSYRGQFWVLSIDTELWFYRCWGFLFGLSYLGFVNSLLSPKSYHQVHDHNINNI